MKKIVLMMMVLLSVTAASAQDGKKQKKGKENGIEMKAPKPLTVEEKTERTAKMLKLKDDQKAQLLELNQNYEKNLQVILTPEQYKKYQMVQQRMGRGGHGPGRGQGPMPGRRPGRMPQDGGDAPQE